MPTPVHLEHIGQIAIHVRNLPAAKAFYQDVLGLPFLFDAGAMAFFQCGPTRLMLGLADSPAPSTNATILYFKVEDLHATHQALESQGVPFLQPPHLVARMPTHDLWMAFLQDPEANTLGLMSEVPRPA